MKWKIALAGSAILATSLVLYAVFASQAGETLFLHQISYTTGISIDRTDPTRFLVASTQGLFSVSPDGIAEPVSVDVGMLIELAVHPDDPAVLFTSGFLSETSKLGLLRSGDGGGTWVRISEGSGGPVAFHALAVSPSQPDLLYGFEDDFRVSRDGGRTWEKGGEVPGVVFDLAVSPGAAETVYAATEETLFVSRDGGGTWDKAYPQDHTATAVTVTADGRVLAFIHGIGLVTAREADLEVGLEWRTLAEGFGDRVLLDLAVAPTDGERMLGVADTGAVMISLDGGRNWTAFEGHLEATPETIARGKTLFTENCQVCHGNDGVGERPDDMYAEDDFGFVAPPLDDSAHAWHHSDEQLNETILEGSDRNERMIAWKELISPGDVSDIVAYIKSLWNFTSLACQGSRHMRCMR